MLLNNDGLVAVFIILAFGLLFALMGLLLRWARRRGRGALMAGAFMSVLAPDPTLEQNIKLAEEAQEETEEEDPGGEP